MDMGQMQDGTGSAELAGERYDDARAWLMFLIDNPDKTVSVDDYKAQIRGARKAVADAHKAMVKGWAA